MPSQGVPDAQPPAAEAEIAHVGRIRDWHAVGRAQARTWRSHRPPRHAHASAPPDRSSRRRTGMALLAARGRMLAVSSNGLLAGRLTEDRRCLNVFPSTETHSEL